MQSQPLYHVTNVPLKTDLKKIRQSAPTRDQNSPLEIQVEETNQDANLSADFAALTTALNELNLTNMSISTKEYIARKATSLQNRANDIRQQHLQHQAITEKIISEHERTKRGDVLDLQELEAVLEHMETLQTRSEYIHFLVRNTPLSAGIIRTHHQPMGEIQTGDTPTTHTNVLL